VKLLVQIRIVPVSRIEDAVCPRSEDGFAKYEMSAKKINIKGIISAISLRILSEFFRASFLSGLGPHSKDPMEKSTIKASSTAGIAPSNIKFVFERATPTLCCCPPDSSSGNRWAYSYG